MVGGSSPSGRNQNAAFLPSPTNYTPNIRADHDLVVVLKKWPRLPADIRRVVIKLITASDPVGQQQRIQAALRLALDIDRALDRLTAGESVDSKEAP